MQKSTNCKRANILILKNAGVKISLIKISLCQIFLEKSENVILLRLPTVLTILKSGLCRQSKIGDFIFSE